MDLLNNNKLLIVHPSHSSSELTNKAAELIAELTVLVRDFSFADASSKEVGQIISVCKKGILQIISMSGSVVVLDSDTMTAERILNEGMEVLVQALNEGMMELRSRAYTDGEVANYAVQLSALIDTVLKWQDTNMGTDTGDDDIDGIELIYD